MRRCDIFGGERAFARIRTRFFLPTFSDSTIFRHPASGINVNGDCICRKLPRHCCGRYAGSAVIPRNGQSARREEDIIISYLRRFLIPFFFMHLSLFLSLFLSRYSSALYDQSLRLSKIVTSHYRARVKSVSVRILIANFARRSTCDRSTEISCNSAVP